MALKLYYHPFSAYSWKVLIPLYEAGTAFTRCSLEDQDHGAAWQRLWPIARFPVLVDDARDRVLPEASIIIEYLDTNYPGALPMLPADADECLEVRLLDRVFDHYIADPLQRIVLDRLRDGRDTEGVKAAHAVLDKSYAWLDERMAARSWAVGDTFTLADCAAAPSLFYADWVHPIGDAFNNLAAYRSRLLARKSVARAVDDARPYRKLFPGGAPDRD